MRYQKRHKLAEHKLLLLWCGVAMLLCGCGTGRQPHGHKAPPSATRGLIDAKGWDFGHNGPLPLVGFWEQHRGVLYCPEDFRLSPARPANYLPMPAFWRAHLLGDTALIGKGFSTFRLRVANVDSLEPLAIDVPYFFGACRLWVNGQTLLNRNPSGKRADGPLVQLPPTQAIGHAHGQVEIVWQVPNLRHTFGPMPRPMRIGSSKAMFAQRDLSSLAAMALVGALGCMAAFFFVFFLFFKNDIATIYFAFSCLGWLVKTVFTNSSVFLGYFPFISWQEVARIEDLAVYITCLSGLLFVTESFGHGKNRRLANVLFIAIYIFIALTLSTPFGVFSHLMLPFQAFAVLLMAFLVYTVANAIVHHQHEAWFVVVAVILGMVVFAYEFFVHKYTAANSAIPLSVGYLVVFIFTSFALGQKVGLNAKKGRLGSSPK